MLDSLYITRSRTRRDLLALFFTNPSEAYYLRQLERMLGYSAASIRRELLKFLGDSLLKTNRVGNTVQYSLNTQHPLHNELKSIISKTVGVEGSLRAALLSIDGIKIAFVYGSFAKHREKPASDIDLMVIGRPNMSALNKAIQGLETKLSREINHTVYSPDEYRSRKRDKSGFIEDLLRSPKMIVVGSEDDL
ncbi:MAG: nucleotidyltransferase domain-containing protein [Candidatus Eisenbacteria bacterium]